MVDESDGIEEAIEGQTRLLVTAAAQAGDRLARMREDALRRAQTTSEREARELQSRFTAEQRTVRADLASVQRADWWEKATPERIAQAYESAVAWRKDEPEAARAEQRIVDELRTRHGITPDELRASPEVQIAAAEREVQEVRERLVGQGEQGMGRVSQAQHEQAARQLKDAEARLTALREAQAAGVAQKEPRFEVYRMVQEGDSTENLRKAGALKMIERTAGTEPGTEPRELGYDMKQWVGKDPDVDRALAQTHPQLLTKDQLASIERADAQHQREEEKRDRTEAAALMAEATTEEDRAQHSRGAQPRQPAETEQHEHRAQDAREEAGTQYDSAERRASTAADLESQGHDHETVDRQMRADISQGSPATEATQGSRAPRARKGRGGAATKRQRERGGLSR